MFVKYPKIVFINLITVLGLTISNSNGLQNDYIKERPSWLNVCKFSDPDFVKCATSSAQNFFIELSKGIPELKNVRRLDPFHANKIKVDQTSSNAVSLKALLTNMDLTGFSKTVVRECKVSRKDFSWVTRYYLPKVNIDSDYEIDGRILIVPLRGKGKLNFNIDNMEAVMRTKTKLYEKGEFTFYNVSSNKVDISISGMRVRLDNLFNGNKELEQSTNAFFNENWKDVFEAMKPIVVSILEEIMLDVLQKSFRYIPANFWIADIPKSTEVYKSK